MDVTAPEAVSAMPSFILGKGSKSAFIISSLASVFVRRACKAKPAEPVYPVKQAMSPTFAPLLVISPSFPTVPRAVPVIVSSSCESVSPPIISVPKRFAHSSIPFTISSTNDSSVSSGRPIAITTPTGFAPFAAMSLRLTATDIHPICHPVIISGKSVFR